MRIRHGGFRRTASFVIMTILACGLLVVGHPGIASDCECGGDHAAGYCPQAPALEEFGGWSLFWHDPCRTPTYCWAGDHYYHTAQAPRVYATVDFLPLFRDESGATVYQARAFREVDTTDAADPVVTYRREAVLTSGELDGGFEPGIRALIGVSLSDWYRVECSYFGSYSWADSATVRYDAADGTGNLLSPFSNFGYSEGELNLDPVPDGFFNPVEGLDFNNRASVSWFSQLDNYELNLRRRMVMPPDRHVCAEMSCLVGLRYMKLRETLDYSTQSPLPEESDGSQNTEHVRVDNDLLGPQVGALAQFLVLNRAWIDFSVTGAILFDQADSTVAANVNYPVDDPTQADFTSEQNATAFLGDLSLQFNYQFAPSGTLRVGYNVMWLTGVALATENFVSDINTLVHNGPGSVNHDGDVVYHGPSIGITWAR